jgi:5-methylcytosine-specific restriction endonuclease McrA
MIRRTPIKRGGPSRKKRPGPPRAGRLKGDDLEALRDATYERDKGVCRSCGTQTIKELPYTEPNSFHMAHIQAKRRVGDNLANTATECGSCHRDYHNFGPSRTKPCPPKPKSVQP